MATDRHRMAVARVRSATLDRSPVGSHVDDSPEQVVVPAPLADAMRALLTGAEPVRFTVTGSRVTLEAGDRQTAGQCLPHDFPDHRRLVRLPPGRRLVRLPPGRRLVRLPPGRRLVRLPPGRRVLVDTAEFRQALKPRPPGRDARAGRRLLRHQPARGDGRRDVTVCEEAGGDGGRVAVGRGWLLPALAAGARETLVPEFGRPTAPLVVRRPDDDTFSLLMPVRWDD
ncbi:hypothetical protein [Streptomyces poriticola]|uniref:hypothetical protein n=1 Tax=Streptomyces poriticola TaxID=3120506 RepID=UPI0038CD965C